MKISGIIKRMFSRSRTGSKLSSALPGIGIKDNYKKTVREKKPELELELMTIENSAKSRKVYDVRSKMIAATKIKRENGYESAIEFLKNVAEECLSRKLSDLVLCINKLIISRPLLVSLTLSNSSK